jgi:putative oxidoreductase
MADRLQSEAGTSPLVACLNAAREWLGHFPVSILQLTMRFGVGLYWFKGALLRIQSPEFGLKLFQEEYGPKLPFIDPALALHLANFNETVCSVLLFLGLFSRLATLPLLVQQLLIIQVFVYRQSYVDTLLQGSCLLFILTRGPGVFSLDHLIGRVFLKRS